MISEQAKAGIDFIFAKAARSHLRLDPGDEIRIDRQPLTPVDPTERHLLVLTITSFQFKLLTLFHIDTDPASNSYFSKSGSKTGALDAFPELGNMCCGAMSRDLGVYFPHLGMSTPYQLDRQCLPHLGVLRPTYLSRHHIAINDAVSLHATLCFCAYGPIDFRVDQTAPAEETGALELF